MDYLALRKNLGDSSLTSNLKDAPATPATPKTSTYGSLVSATPTGTSGYTAAAASSASTVKEYTKTFSSSSYSASTKPEYSYATPTPKKSPRKRKDSTSSSSSSTSSSDADKKKVLPPKEPFSSSPYSTKNYSSPYSDTGAKSKNGHYSSSSIRRHDEEDAFGHLETTSRTSSKMDKPFIPRTSGSVGTAGKKESRHFQSLQIFTSHAEPTLDEFLTRREQIELEHKHRDEEDKLYRKFLANRREEEEKIKVMEDEEREVYLLDLNRDERSKVIKLAEKHCKQMLDLIHKKKVAYFEKGGDDDWKQILARSYPKDPPEVVPPIYNKEQVYENNYDVFEEVDLTATRIAKDDYKLFTNLVRDLIEGYTSDVEKARVIFRYMTERKFSHEVWFLYYPEEGNKRGAPVQLFRGVEFGLETKALLFKRLCAYAGLHAEVIKGYSKSSGYLPGEEFVDASYRNSWNAVFVAGGWRLVQANWGMMSVNNKVARETRTIYQDHYFLTDPDKFIFEFFPVNKDWQLMAQPITLQEFEDLPLLRSTFFHYGLGLEGSAASVLEADEGGECRVTLLAQPEIAFHYEISFFKSGNTAVSVEGSGMVPLARFLMLHSEEDSTHFQFRAPQKGSYLLDCFAAVYPTYEQCQAEEPVKYINICRFKINCRGLDKPNLPLPDCAPGEWGPTKAVKLLGLLPSSHPFAVINAAPDSGVNLGGGRELTLNMEFEMTRDMLDFIVRLHKHGDHPYEQGGKKRDARYRIKDSKYLLVDIRVPQEGQYGLEIFARQNWEEKMVHGCKYLINCDV